MRTCNGPTSFCTLAGFAFESTCFTGRRCVYDVVGDWNWRQSVQTHRIWTSIRDVYTKYEKVPSGEPDTECVDCALWRFHNGNETDMPTSTLSTTASTSSSVVRTRTTTCVYDDCSALLSLMLTLL
jgi:lipase ATG15